MSEPELSFPEKLFFKIMEFTEIFMSTTINLSNGIHSRLMAISQQIGRTETELIEEAILSYVEDLEDIQEVRNRLMNPPERYLTLEEVEQELDLAN
jgi:RHH-type rel operon transcriptional repressor/antitoxin RelB